MSAPKTPPIANDAEGAHSLHHLVRPFLPGNTKDWRRRSTIITTLNNIRDLADEASRCLDDVRNVKQAADALKDMEGHLAALWPGILYDVSKRPNDKSSDGSEPFAATNG